MEHGHIRTDGGVPTTTELDGQVAVAAGGTDGIGKATATKLAEYGATTIVVGSTPDRGRDAVTEIVLETGNENVEYRRADLSRMVEVRRLADEIRSEYDRLDVRTRRGSSPTSRR